MCSMKQAAFLLSVTLLAASCKAQDIREPPSVKEPLADKVPDEYIRKEGKFQLPCEATGKPEPAYIWMYNGRELDLNKRNIRRLQRGTIEIFDFEKYGGDEGEYQCVASNKYGKSLSQMFKVMAATLTATGKKEIIPYSGDVGKPLMIPKTVFNSAPVPSYAWKTVSDLDDPTPRALVRSKRILQDLEGNLYFTSLQANDKLDPGRFYKIDVFNHVVDATLGGSYSSVAVDVSMTPRHRAAARMYPKTATLKVDVLEGTEMRIQCIFSGYPEVTVTWSGPSKILATPEESETRLVLKKMTKEAAGEHECTGSNSAGSDRSRITVEMHTIPKFTTDGRPSKQTLTEGQTATFKCQTTEDTNPQATVEWMINGDLVEDRFPGARTEVTTITNGKVITIIELKRDEDIKVIQCKASNKYKTLYIDAPLNVLKKTILTEKPVNQMIESNTTQVVFVCRATSDPSTPPTVEWQRDGKGLSFYDDPKMIEDKNAGTLTLNLDGLVEDQKAAYSGEYMCKASNGYSTDSHTAVLEYNKGGNTGAVTSAGFPLWIILVIVAGVLLLLILVLICCICIQRNKGDSYPVDTKERQHGNDPEKDCEEDFFRDFIRREPDEAVKGSKASLTDINPMTMGSIDSLDQYANWDEGRFSEDGSFIGEYQDRKKINIPVSNTSNV